MPGWLVNLLIGLAVKLGPYALRALLPKVPDWAKAIIEELIKAIEGANIQIIGAQELKKQAVLQARLQLKKKGTVGVPSDIKKV